MKKLSFLLTALLTLATPAFAAPKTAPISLTNAANSGTVNFLAVGRPSMLKIHGTSSGPSSQLSLSANQLSGTISMDTDKFDTGLPLRTQHMKEKYLQVKEFPQAKLTLVDAPVDADFAKTLSNSGEKPFRGKLSLHGKEKEIAGTFSAKNGLVKANFPVTLSDYGIDVPKYLGITVADSVTVDVEIPLLKK